MARGTCSHLLKLHFNTIVCIFLMDLNCFLIEWNFFELIT